jgi:hypothetical protein
VIRKYIIDVDLFGSARIYLESMNGDTPLFFPADSEEGTPARLELGNYSMEFEGDVEFRQVQ